MSVASGHMIILFWLVLTLSTVLAQKTGNVMQLCNVSYIIWACYFRSSSTWCDYWHCPISEVNWIILTEYPFVKISTGKAGLRLWSTSSCFYVRLFTCSVSQCYIRIFLSLVDVYPSGRVVSVPGGEAKFTCLAQSVRDNVFSIQWFANGTILEEEERAEMSFASGVGILTLRNLTLDYNETEIACSARFNSGKVLFSNSATLLLLQGEPKINDVTANNSALTAYNPWKNIVDSLHISHNSQYTYWWCVCQELKNWRLAHNYYNII